ncbi:hypothetical protein AAMO2058_001035600 [Amorphochlora amoebiformis]
MQISRFHICLSIPGIIRRLTMASCAFREKGTLTGALFLVGCAVLLAHSSFPEHHNPSELLSHSLTPKRSLSLRESRGNLHPRGSPGILRGTRGYLWEIYRGPEERGRRGLAVRAKKKVKKRKINYGTGEQETWQNGYLERNEDEITPPPRRTNEELEKQGWDPRDGQDGVRGYYPRPWELHPYIYDREQPWKPEPEEHKKQRMKELADPRTHPWDFRENQIVDNGTDFDDESQISPENDMSIRYSGMSYPEYLKQQNEKAIREIDEDDFLYGTKIRELEPPVTVFDFGDPNTANPTRIPGVEFSRDCVEIGETQKRADIGVIPMSPLGVSIEFIVRVDDGYFEFPAAEIYDTRGNVREGAEEPGSSVDTQGFDMVGAVSGLGKSSLDFIGFSRAGGKWVLGNETSISLSQREPEAFSLWRHVVLVKSLHDTKLFVDGSQAIVKYDPNPEGFRGGKLVLGSIASNLPSADAKIRFCAAYNGSFIPEVVEQLYTKRIEDIRMLPGRSIGILISDYYLRPWMPRDRWAVINLAKEMYEDHDVPWHPELSDRIWMEPESFFEELHGELWVVEKEPSGPIIAAVGYVPSNVLRYKGSVDIQDILVHRDYRWYDNGREENYLEHQLLQFIEARCFEFDWHNLHMETSSNFGQKYLDLIWHFDYREMEAYTEEEWIEQKERDQEPDPPFYDNDGDAVDAKGRPLDEPDMFEEYSPVDSDYVGDELYKAEENQLNPRWIPTKFLQTNEKADLLLRKEVPYMLNQSIFDEITEDELLEQYEAQYAEEEDIWEVVDSCGTRIMGAPKQFVMTNRWLVRGIGVLLLNKAEDKIYVHRRSATKTHFPGMYDMFIGGHVMDQEPDLVAIYRELKEEIGLDGPLDLCDAEFQCVVKTELNSVFAGIYRGVAPLNFEPKFKDGEIEWGTWMTRREIEDKIQEGDWKWVPDGLQVWDAMKEYERFERRAVV